MKFPTQLSIVQSVTSNQSSEFRLQLMFKMSSLFLNAGLKTWTPLLDGPVDDILIKHLPLFNQMRLEVIDVMNAGAIHPLLQYPPDVILNWTKIRAAEV